MTPPNPLLPFLTHNGYLVLDGGLATELERRGVRIQGDPLWSARLLLTDPDLIQQLHFDYFAAGADVATSASYQATFPGFARIGIDSTQAAELMRLSVRLAQQARDAFWLHTRRSGRLRPLVAASIGSYGAYLANGSEYRGDYGLSLAELMAFHRPRMAVLVESGAELLACETIPCQLEAEALLRLLAEFPTIHAWLSFSCQDEGHVCHGEPFRSCVALARNHPQVVAVGLNCTPPSYAQRLLQTAADAATQPLLAYPNSGEQWDAAAHCWVPKPESVPFADLARRWFSAGARLIGGCCRTTPAQIQAVTQALAHPPNSHP